MESLTTFRIQPTAPFHLGERGVGLEGSAELIHSDTLYAALCTAWHLLGIVPLLEFDIKQPPFRLSSLLPYIPVDRTTIDLFPRPLVSFVLSDPAARSATKRARRVRLVSRDTLNVLAAGQQPSAPALIQWGTVMVTAAESETIRKNVRDGVLWSSGSDSMRQRVTVDRLTSASDTWFLGSVTFSQNVGLYFLTDADEDCSRRIRQGLEVLQDEGLGGERSSGFGRFQLLDQRPVTFPTAGDHHLSLGLYCPADAEEVAAALAGARYRIVTRTGFLHSPYSASYRRLGIRMIAEGALLSAPVKGRVADVRPRAVVPPFPHEVLRYGQALTFPGRFFAAEESHAN